MLTVTMLCEKIGAQVLCGEPLLQREVSGCYCGDLLSWVMSRATSGDAWITVMGNINSVGVAVLADVSCIVLSENAALDDNALTRAQENDVIILKTQLNTYEVACIISSLLEK